MENAIEIGRPIDDLHEDENRRMGYLDSLSMPACVSLLCSNPELFYTSSNHLLFDKFKRYLGESGKNASDVLQEHGVALDSEFGRNFLLRAINYGRFCGGASPVLEREEIGGAIDALIKPLSTKEPDVKYFYLIANAIGKMAEMEGVDSSAIEFLLGKEIVRARTENLDGNNLSARIKERALESMLMQLDPSTPLVSNADKIKIATIKEAAVYKPKEYMDSEGVITAVQVFDKEDTQEYHWGMTKKWFTQMLGKPKYEDENKVIFEKGKKRMIMYIGENEGENQQFVKEQLGQNPNLIISFRGHSYSLKDNFPSDIFEDRPGNVLFVPGSCGSASSTPEYIMENPHTTLKFVSNTSTGRGTATNALLESFLSAGKESEFQKIVSSAGQVVDKRLRTLGFANVDTSEVKQTLNVVKLSNEGEQLLKYLMEE